MKKIIPVLLCVLLASCNTAPKKEGIALGFQRIKVDDPEFLKADYGQSKVEGADATPDKPLAQTTSAAIAGGSTGLVVAAAPMAKTVAVGGVQAISAAALAPVVVAGALGAGVAYVGTAANEWINGDKDCGPGWALFTLQTAEGEVKTIRQPRNWVCKYKNGDKVQYVQTETGIMIMKKE